MAQQKRHRQVRENSGITFSLVLFMFAPRSMPILLKRCSFKRFRSGRASSTWNISSKAIDTLSRNIIERYQVIPKASTADSTVEFAKGFDTGFDGAVMVCKRRILAKKTSR